MNNCDLNNESFENCGFHNKGNCEKRIPVCIYREINNIYNAGILSCYCEHGQCYFCKKEFNKEQVAEIAIGTSLNWKPQTICSECEKELLEHLRRK